MDHLFLPSAGSTLGRSPDRRGGSLLVPRLIIGLIQGALLYGFYRYTSYDAFDLGEVSGPLAAWVLIAAYAPPLWLAVIGQLPLRGAVIWAAIGTAVLGLMGLASGVLPDGSHSFEVMILCLPAALFCAHHLVVTGMRAGELVAPYPDYYEQAWTTGIQLALSLLFLVAFWIIMFLGAALFNAIGISFVEQIIENKAFVFFASSLVFALGVELTDVRDGLTQGIRTVALTLLSWLLPVAVLLAAAFLITLPFAGLSQLSSSLSPAGLMLAASAGLIILINTVYQDGEQHLSESTVLRMIMRVGCVLLLPMTAFALWAVSVRIGQYGLTVERIVAVVSAVIGLLYSLGYAAAQLPRRARAAGWLPTLELTNVVVGAITALTLVAFSTPWLNPVQLSISSQIARLKDPNLQADDVPYYWLANNAGPRGRAALDTLAASPNAAIAERAKQARENSTFNRRGPAKGFIVFPEGTTPPEGFIRDGLCFVDTCPARIVDFDNDGEGEVLLRHGPSFAVFKRDSDGQWAEIGTLENAPSCKHSPLSGEEMDSSDLKPLPPKSVPSFEIAGKTFEFTPKLDCPITEN